MKKVKYICTILLVIVLTVLSMTTSFAESDFAGNFNGFQFDDFAQSDEYVYIVDYRGDKKNVTIPTTIEDRKVKSMLGYGKIEKLHIPKGVDVENLYSAKNLKKVTVASGHKEYTVRNNILYNKNKTKLIFVPRAAKNVKIPITVTKFERGAFANTKIRKFKMPIQADVLSNDMFDGCKKLKEVTLHVGVEKVAPGAFKNCVNLKKVKIPSSVKVISAAAFYGCKSLDYYPVPKYVKLIDYHAFYGCTSLKTVKLSDKVKSIGEKAFEKCTNLETLEFGRGLTELKWPRIIKDCKKLKELHVPKTVKKLGLMSLNSKYLKKIYIYNKKCEIERIDDRFLDIKIRPAINKKTTIYGYKGSTAQKYAKKNGNKFVALD